MGRKLGRRDRRAPGPSGQAPSDCSLSAPLRDGARDIAGARGIQRRLGCIRPARAGASPSTTTAREPSSIRSRAAPGEHAPRSTSVAVNSQGWGAVALDHRGGTEAPSGVNYGGGLLPPRRDRRPAALGASRRLSRSSRACGRREPQPGLQGAISGPRRLDGVTAIWVRGSGPGSRHGALHAMRPCRGLTSAAELSVTRAPRRAGV
jgi:hypothetical protein